MVNIFTKKNKHKTENVAEDSQPLSSTAFSSRKVASGKQIPKEVDELPQLRDYPATKYVHVPCVIASLILISRREALFDQKLELCSQIFNFEDVSGSAL